jgi:hypothetical protein
VGPEFRGLLRHREASAADRPLVNHHLRCIAGGCTHSFNLPDAAGWFTHFVSRKALPIGRVECGLSAWAAGSTSKYTEVSRCCRGQHRSSPVYLLAPPAFSGPRPVWARWAECRRRHMCELFTRPPRVGTRSGGFPVTGGGCCVGECAGHGPLLGIHDCSCQLDMGGFGVWSYGQLALALAGHIFRCRAGRPMPA